MDILLMAAGSGERMNSEVPKSFMRMGPDNLQMWYYVAKRQGLDKYTRLSRSLVMQEQHRKWYDYENIEWDKDYPIDGVDYITDMSSKGPAWSVMAATLNTHPSHPILILDSDCWVEPTLIGHQRDIMSGTQMQQISRMRISWETSCVVYGVRVFEDTDHAAEIKIGNSPLGNIDCVQEGGVNKGGLLNIGAYWFNSVQEFRARLAEVKKEGEVKISDVVNVRTRGVECMTLSGKFVNIGTEYLLNKYKTTEYKEQNAQTSRDV